MTRKQTLRLSLATVAIVVVLAVLCGLFTAPTLTAQAEAVPEIAGQAYGSPYTFGSGDFAANGHYDYTFEIQDNGSGEDYRFDAAPADAYSYNPDFAYPCDSTTASDFLSSLWTLTVQEYSELSETYVPADPMFVDGLVAYFATIGEDGKPAEYIDSIYDSDDDSYLAGVYAVVICNGDKDDPLCYAYVNLTAGPATWKNAEIEYGTYSGSDILSELIGWGSGDLVEFDAGYDKGFITYVYKKGDVWSQYARYQGSSMSGDAPYTTLPAGDYEITYNWKVSPYGYNDWVEAHFFFTVKPVVVEEYYSSGEFTRTWGAADLADSQPYELSGLDAELVWYYDDGTEDGAVLPSGLDLRPGEYEVWPVLEGDDVTNGNVVMGYISAYGTNVSKAGNHATLTINAIDISYSIPDAAFEGLTYHDVSTFAFQQTVYSYYSGLPAYSTAVFNSESGVHFDVRWYWCPKADESYDYDTKYDFNEMCDAGIYTVRYEFIGEHAYGFKGTITKNGVSFFNDASPRRITIGKKSIDDATIVMGTEPGTNLKMYTGVATEYDLNKLYYRPTGFTFSGYTAAPGVTLVFDGWKENPADPDETPIEDISEEIGGTFYAYNIHAVKEVDGVFVKDDNYIISDRKCKVTVLRRRIKVVEAVGSLTYNGEVQWPDFEIKGVDGYLSPDEGSIDEFGYSVADRWSIVQETGGINPGSSVGSGYSYGVEVIDNNKYIIDYSMDDLHNAKTWGYSIEKAYPDILLEQREDWFYLEEVPSLAVTQDEFALDGKTYYVYEGGMYLESSLSVGAPIDSTYYEAVDVEYILKYKLSYDYLSATDSDIIEIDYIEWSYNNSGMWYTLNMFSPISTSIVALEVGDTISIRVNTKGTDNYYSDYNDIDFIIAEAPIYLIYNESDVTFAPANGSVGPEWTTFSVDMYRAGSGVNPFSHDDTHYTGTMYSTFDRIEGEDSVMFSGEHSFTLGYDDPSIFSGTTYIANPTINWSIAWHELTVEQFVLPTNIIYGDEDGTTPVIDYKASSDFDYVATEDNTFQAGKTYYENIGYWQAAAVVVGDPIVGTYYELAPIAGNDDPIVGAITGFGNVGDSFKYAVEVWEYAVIEDDQVAAADYTGTWKKWNNEQFPKDVASYYVRFSVKFYQNGNLNQGMYSLANQYGTFTIVPKEIELVWIGNNVAYTGNAQKATVTATLCYGEAVEKQITYTETFFTDYKEGGYPLTASVNANALGNYNYTIKNSTATFVVNKIKLPVKALPVEIKYGEVPTYIYQIDGFMNGENEEDLRAAGTLTGAPVLTSEYKQYDNVGSYAITIVTGTLWALNYEFECDKESGSTLTVIKNDLDGFGITNGTKTYTGEYLTSQGVVEFSYGTLSGEMEDLTITYSRTAGGYNAALPDWKNEGTYTVYYQVESGNYNTITGNYTFTIEPANIGGSILPAQSSFEYNGNDIGAGSNTVDTLTLAHKTDEFTAKKYNTTGKDDAYTLTERPTFVNAGTYTVYYKITAANHNDLFGSYQIVIDKKSVTVSFSVNELAKDYDRTAFTPDGAGVVNGVVAGQSLSTEFGGGSRIAAGNYGSVPFTLVAAVGTNRDNYTLTAVGEPYSNVVDGAYSVSSETGYVNLRINQITVAYDQYIGAAKINSIQWDGSDKVFKLEMTNKVLDDDVSVCLAESETAGTAYETMTESNYGQYKYWVKLSGGAAGNYKLNKGDDETVLFTIASKVIDVTFDTTKVNSFVYGDTSAFDILSANNFYDFLVLSDSLDVNESASDVLDLSFKKDNATVTLGARSAVGQYKFVVATKENVTKYSFNYTINTTDAAYIEVQQKTININWTISSNGNEHTELTEEGEELIFDLTYSKAAIKPAAELLGVEDGDDVTITWAAGSTSVNVVVSANSTDKYKKATISGIAGNDVANYKLANNAVMYHYFTIVPRVIGIEWDNLAFTYDGDSHKPTATATNVCAGDDVTITVIGAQTNAKDTVYTATASALNNTNYALPQITAQSYRINYRVVTVTSWSNLNPTYNGQAQVPSYALGNVIEQDQAEIAIVFDEDFINRGEHIYNKNNMHFNNANYVFKDAESVTIDIRRKELALSWRIDGVDTSSVTYDGNLHTVSAVVETGVEGETVAQNLRSQVEMTDVGNYIALFFVSNCNAEGSEVDNYYVAESTLNRSFSWSIEQREITAVFSDAPLIYNGESQKPAVTDFDGIVNADADRVTINWNTGKTKAAGEYVDVSFSLTGERSANYKLSTDTKSFNIEKKELVITWSVDNTATSKVTYDGNDHTVTATAFTGIQGETVTLALDGELIRRNRIANGYNASVAVKSYKANEAENNDFNYEVKASTANNTFHWEIEAKEIIVDYKEEAHKSFVYGDADSFGAIASPYTYLSATLGNGDVITDVVSLRYVDSTEADIAIAQLGLQSIVDKYTIVATDLNNINYVVTLAVNENEEAYVEVTNAALTEISVSAATRTYDGIDKASVVTAVATAVNAQAVTFTYATEQDAEEYGAMPTFKDAGTYTVYYKVNAANHSEESGSFTVTIENADFADVSVAQAAALTYNSAEQAAAVTTNAGTQIAADVAAFTYSKTAAGTFAAAVPSFKDAGEYTVYYKVNLVNYNEATGSFKVTIGKKALTVTADNKNIGYGDYVPTYTESYDGFAGTEDKAVLGGTLTLTCSYKQYDKAGTYTITPAGYTSNNYEITFVNGTLTVAAGDFEEVKVDNSGKVSLDVDEKAAEGNGVTINKIIESAAKAGDNAAVTLTIGEGAEASTIVLDAAAIAAMKDKDVKLSYEVKKGDDAAAAVKGAALVLDITLSGMENGSATITVPFVNEAPTGKIAKVFYVDENGKKTDMQGTFENDQVTFTTTHNSTYIVSYVLSTATIVGIIIACVAAVAIVVVVVILLGKKKKGAAPAPKAEEAEAEAEAEEAPKADDAE